MSERWQQGDPLGIFSGHPLVPPWAARYGLNPPPSGVFEDYLDPESPFFRPDVAGVVMTARRAYIEAQRAEDERRRRATAERARHRAEASIVLSRTSDPHEAVAALERPHGGLPASLCRSTFLRIVETIGAPPSHDIVTVTGRASVAKLMFSWAETSRVGAFVAPGGGRRFVDRYGEQDAHWHQGFNVWVDTLGDVWTCETQGDPREDLKGKHCLDSPWAFHQPESRVTAHVVLEEGSSFRTRRRRPKGVLFGFESLVVDGRRVWRHPDAEQPEGIFNISYTAAIASALEACATQSASPQRA